MISYTYYKQLQSHHVYIYIIQTNYVQYKYIDMLQSINDEDSI